MTAYTPTEGDLIDAWAGSAAIGPARRVARTDARRAIARVQAEAWAECARWHAAQGMPVAGGEDEHNPYRIEARS